MSSLERKKRHTQSKSFSKKKPYIPSNPKALNRPTARPTSSLEELGEDIRLNKYIAHCGICSRRKASEYIFEGLVQVNGEVVKEPGRRVTSKDEIRFRNKVVRPEAHKVYILSLIHI